MAAMQPINWVLFVSVHTSVTLAVYSYPEERLNTFSFPRRYG